MPTLDANGITINYERAGSGPPLLLIMGLGGTLNGWRHQVPALSQYFDVIRFDNRGAGASSAPQHVEAYSMQQFAADAIAVLDHCGVARADIFGVSMGGMIAQNLVIDHPERVNRLILGCTAPGGANTIHPEMWVVELLMSAATKSAEESMHDAIRYNFAPDFPAQHPHIIEEYVREGSKHVMPPHGFMGQWSALGTHDTLERLHQIHVPTLIQHGEADQLIPFGNAEILAQHIPHARLQRILGGGHVYFLEQATEVNAAVLEFLRQE